MVLSTYSRTYSNGNFRCCGLLEKEAFLSTYKIQSGTNTNSPVVTIPTTFKKLGWSLERTGIEVTFIAIEPNFFPDVHCVGYMR